MLYIMLSFLFVFPLKIILFYILSLPSFLVRYMLSCILLPSRAKRFACLARSRIRALTCGS